MIIYFLVFLVLVFIGFFKTQFNLKSEVVLPIIGLMLIFFAAFRGAEVDRDYQNYLESFNLFLSPADYFLHTEDWFFFEPFFYLIPSVCKYIGLPNYPLFVFFIFSFIAVVINLVNIKRLSTFPILSVVVWFGFYFLLHELTQIRAAVASGLMLLCVYHHFHKHYFKFVCFFLLAIMFHYSALLILPILFLNPHTFSKQASIIILGLAFILGLLHSDVFLQPIFLINASFVKKLTVTLQAMNEDENTINLLNPMFLSQVIISGWLFIHHKMIKEQNKYAYLLLKLQLLSIFCLCAFSSIAFVAYRISEFYGVVSIFTIPFLVYTFKQKMYGYIAVVSYSLFMLILTVIAAKLVGPYKLIFFNG